MSKFPRASCRRRLPRAVSLVETVIVVLIIGIMIAVGAPKMIDSLSYQRAVAAAQRMAAHLRLVRHDARNRGSSSSVLFSTAEQAYTLANLVDPDHPGRRYRIDCGAEPIMAELASAQFGADQEVIFNGFGLPDTGGSAAFRVGRYLATVTVASDGAIAVDAIARTMP